MTPDTPIVVPLSAVEWNVILGDISLAVTLRQALVAKIMAQEPKQPVPEAPVS